MSNNIVGKGLLTAVTFGALLLATYGCEQQAPRCSSGRGGFATRFRTMGGPPECANLKGEMIGFSTYNAETSDERKPDLDHASIAVQAESLGILQDNAALAGITDPDPNHKPYAFGPFTTPAPVGDFCTVPTLSVATQVLPEVAANEEAEISEQPPTNIAYDWKNIRLYVTSSAYGTQFTGDLTRTENGVACQYSVIGMWPYIDCSAEDPANPENTIADDRLCDPEANPAEGRPVGSGINPDFPTKCDPDLKVCLLTSDTIPALH